MFTTEERRAREGDRQEEWGEEKEGKRVRRGREGRGVKRGRDESQRETFKNTLFRIQRHLTWEQG